jgi:hypothetical protein
LSVCCSEREQPIRFSAFLDSCYFLVLFLGESSHVQLHGFLQIGLQIRYFHSVLLAEFRRGRLYGFLDINHFRLQLFVVLNSQFQFASYIAEGQVEALWRSCAATVFVFAYSRAVALDRQVCSMVYLDESGLNATVADGVTKRSSPILARFVLLCQVFHH